MIQAIELQQPIVEPAINRERRGSSRFETSLPVSIQTCPAKKESSLFSGETLNFSGHGIYFVTNSTFARGKRLTLTIALPGRATGPDTIVTRARVRVARSEAIWHRGERRMGVGAEIDYYSV